MAQSRKGVYKMKKIITLICTIACVLSLTACGETETVSEFQQEKIETAKKAAVETYLPMLGDYANSDINFDEYSKEEISYMFSDSVDGNGFKSALISFQSAMDTIGEIVEYGEASATVDDDKIIVRVDVKGTVSDADAEIILSNDIFLVMKSAALNPKAGLGDKMKIAALNTLIGMGTVFLVLILISFLISLFRFIPGIVDGIANVFTRKKKEEVKEESINNTIQQIVEKEESSNDLSQDLELVAVISAAIAAYEGEAGTDGFMVRSIRKVNRRA